MDVEDDDDQGPESESESKATSSSPSSRIRGRAGWAVVLMLAIVVGQFVYLFSMFSPGWSKTVIGGMNLANGTTLSVGRGHEGKTSHVYYVKVSGEHCKPVAWTKFASGVMPLDRCDMARSPDSRFTGMVVRGKGTLGSVIYDAVDDELWFGNEADIPKRVKFVRAWKALEKVDPRMTRKAE